MNDQTTEEKLLAELREAIRAYLENSLRKEAVALLERRLAEYRTEVEQAVTRHVIEHLRSQGTVDEVIAAVGTDNQHTLRALADR